MLIRGAPITVVLSRVIHDGAAFLIAVTTFQYDSMIAIARLYDMIQRLQLKMVMSSAIQDCLIYSIIEIYWERCRVRAVRNEIFSFLGATSLFASYKWRRLKEK
jgi:hypothetical protein